MRVEVTSLENLSESQIEELVIIVTVHTAGRIQEHADEE